MSWIIKDTDAYVYGFGGEMYWAILTYDRDAAKKFETKHDAAAYMKQYDLTGHIIPA